MASLKNVAKQKKEENFETLMTSNVMCYLCVCGRVGVGGSKSEMCTIPNVYTTKYCRRAVLSPVAEVGLL